MYLKNWTLKQGTKNNVSVVTFPVLGKVKLYFKKTPMGLVKIDMPIISNGTNVTHLLADRLFGWSLVFINF